MGEGDQRNSKRTTTLDPRELTRLAKESAASPRIPRDPSDDDQDRDGLAPLIARAARGSDPPLTGRTVTLDDPLTTSLLAEVTRHARTLEMSPEQIEAAVERANAPDEDDHDDDHDAAPPRPATKDRSGTPSR